MSGSSRIEQSLYSPRNKPGQPRHLEPEPNKVLIKRCLASAKFDACMSLIVLANAVMIGIEQSFLLEGRRSISIQVFQHLFLVVYLGELVARVYALGLSSLSDHWIKFDTFLTVTGILYAWILDPLFASVDRLKLLVLLRLARLLRLSRVMRLLLGMRELYTLVRAVKNSVITFTYTLGFLLLSIYAFSYVGLEVIASHSIASDPVIGQHVERYFRNLPVTMFTLIRFACLDDMSTAYDILVQEDWVLAIYFVSVILIIGIVFMNLLSAAVINSSLEQSAVDREAIKVAEENQRKRVLKELRSLFNRINVEGSGVITRLDLKKVNLKDENSICSAMGTSDMMKVFQQLDVDNSGSVEMDEFVDGMESALSTAPIELKRLEFKLNVALGQLRRCETEQQRIADKWDSAFLSMQDIVRELRASFALQLDHMQADCSYTHLEAENAALKEQLAAADDAQQDVLKRAWGEYQESPPDNLWVLS